MRAVSLTPEIEAALRAGAVVAIGASGGKDSDAAAIAAFAHLDAVGHTGPRVLINADLGMVEHSTAAAHVRRLADFLHAELITVRRKAGGLMERWEGRWRANLRRYANLECVKLILPWSTAQMRFCTGELKEAVICAELARRYPGQMILSVCGIRREESASRAKAPIAKEKKRLFRKKAGTRGLGWNIILDWTLADVLDCHREAGFPLNEVYVLHGLTRFSCMFCILGSKGDLRRSALIPYNLPVYRRMVALEIRSTFSFQDKSWLGDVAPELLSAAEREGLAAAKLRAARREAAEARIPRSLLYTAGWPTRMPTPAEAELLAEVRREVAQAVGIPARYLDAGAIMSRYAELLEAKAAKEARPRRKRAA